MKEFFLCSMLLCAIPGLSHAGYVEGYITQVFAGKDAWYGVRFYLNVTSNQANNECNPMFVYSEPETGSGHKEKVAVFTSAYLVGKKVGLTVENGRGGFCKIVEGSMF